MKTRKTISFLESNNVEVLIADKTEPVAEIDELLVSLGNAGKAIPFYAIFPAGGSEPITFSGLLRQKSLLGYLRQAVATDPASQQAIGQRPPSTVETRRAGLSAASQR